MPSAQNTASRYRVLSNEFRRIGDHRADDVQQSPIAARTPGMDDASVLDEAPPAATSMELGARKDDSILGHCGFARSRSNGLTPIDQDSGMD
jgi:hypothetical protein